MDRNRKIRYLLAVYAIVLSMAVIFALIGKNQTEVGWLPYTVGLITNLSTELIGVVIIFLLVNLLFFVDDWNLTERVENLIQRLEITRPPASDFFIKWPELDPYIQKAQQIDMCGVTLTTIINKQFSNLRDRLHAGADIRIMLIDPDSLAPNMSAQRSTSPDDTDYYLVRLEATLREIAYLFRSWEEFKRLAGTSSRSGSLVVRLLSYAPSFELISLDSNQSTGVLFVEIYIHKFGYSTPPTFDLNAHRDGIWYKFFTEQFEQMWEAARPWEPHELNIRFPHNELEH
jgi:hypothetical protein